MMKRITRLCCPRNLLRQFCGICAIVSTCAVVYFIRSAHVRTHTVQLQDSGESYELRIIVIVYNRAKSLRRLLESLNNASYEQDVVLVEVWIDRSKNGSFCEDTLKTANAFKFAYGAYRTILHRKHVGIFGQWLQTWRPVKNTKEIAVILEDDLTVSPYFYRYLKLVHRKYDSISYINGYALQGVSINHQDGKEQLRIPKENKLFLYPVLGTWGFSPNNRNWIEFLAWFQDVYDNNSFQPYVPGNIVTLWYKIFKQQGKSDSLWSIWHIYFAWQHNEYTLYSNFAENQGLTANWKEKGLHYSDSNVSASNELLQTWREDYDILPDEPVIVNIAGKLMGTERNPQVSWMKFLENIKTHVLSFIDY